MEVSNNTQYRTAHRQDFSEDLIVKPWQVSVCVNCIFSQKVCTWAGFQKRQMAHLVGRLDPSNKIFKFVYEIMGH